MSEDSVDQGNNNNNTSLEIKHNRRPSLSDFISNCLAISPQQQTLDANNNVTSTIDDLETRQHELQQKSYFLLGVAQKLKEEHAQNAQNKPDQQQKAEELLNLLQSDAQSLMSFAFDIKQYIDNKKKSDNDTTDQSSIVDAQNKMKQTLTDIDAFGSNVKVRYDKFANHVLTKSSKIVKDTVNSKEAEEFLKIGKNILNQWVSQRDALLKKAVTPNNTNDNENNEEDNLADTTDVPDWITTTTPELIHFLTNARVDVVLFLNNIEDHKTTLISAGEDIQHIIEAPNEDGTSLAEDEDVKALIALSKEAKRYTTKVLTAATRDENLDKAAKKIHKGTDDVLDHIERNQIPQEALSVGAELLNKYQEHLTPDGLMKRVEILKDSPEKRQKFLNDVKTEVLTFILKYLPSIKMKPLIHEDPQSCHYELKNIDLSNFSCRAEDVDVILLEERRALLVTAHHISCLMDNLEFNYKSYCFPYASASGKASAKATDVKIILELRIEEIDDNNNNNNKDSVTTTTSSFLSSSSSDDDDDEEDQYANPNQYNDNNTTTGQQEQESSITTTDQQQQPDQQQPKEQQSTKTQKVIRSVNKTLAESAKYRLVLAHHPQGIVQIGNLDIELKDFWLKSLANILLNMFKTEISKYVTGIINSEILKESSNLLKQINKVVSTYLPILARVLLKLEKKSGDIEAVVIKTAKTIQQEVLADKKAFKQQQQEQQQQVVETKAITTKQPQLVIKADHVLKSPTTAISSKPTEEEEKSK